MHVLKNPENYLNWYCVLLLVPFFFCSPYVLRLVQYFISYFSWLKERSMDYIALAKMVAIVNGKVAFIVLIFNRRVSGP